MMHVQDLMSSEVLSIREDESIAKARAIMGLARVRHVPVVDKYGDFVGLITHRDILAVTVSRLADITPEVQDDLDEGIMARDYLSRKTKIMLDPDVEDVDEEMDRLDAEEQGKAKNPETDEKV